MNNTSKDTSTGSGTGDATISVSLSSDGTYAITAVSSDVVMPVTGQTAGSLEVFGTGCVVAVKTDSREHVPLQRTVGDAIGASGTVDPKTPNVLAGSRTEVLSQSDNNKRERTTTWQFRRQ